MRGPPGDALAQQAGGNVLEALARIAEHLPNPGALQPGMFGRAEEVEPGGRAGTCEGPDLADATPVTVNTQMSAAGSSRPW
jgi:hypothetical protein